MIDEFLEHVQKHCSPETYEWYRLQRLLDDHPRMDALNLKPHHVQKWADSYQLSVRSNHNCGRRGNSDAAMYVSGRPVARSLTELDVENEKRSEMRETNIPP